MHTSALCRFQLIPPLDYKELLFYNCLVSFATNLAKVPFPTKKPRTAWLADLIAYQAAPNLRKASILEHPSPCRTHFRLPSPPFPRTVLFFLLSIPIRFSKSNMHFLPHIYPSFSEIAKEPPNLAVSIRSHSFFYRITNRWSIS
jgi:hypothetical protein